MIARLLHDFDVCKGIEVLENLNGAAQIICNVEVQLPMY